MIMFRLNDKGIRYVATHASIGAFNQDDLMHLTQVEFQFDGHFYSDEAATYIANDLGLPITADMIERVGE